MNRLYIYTLLGIGILLNTACKRESLLTYNALDNIYFHCIINAQPHANPPSMGVLTDSLHVTFAFYSPSVTDTIVGIPIKVTGEARDFDRVFDVVADPASSAEAKHYEFPYPFTVRAGSIQDSLFIRFKRTPDLKTKAVDLILHLKANENFQTQLLHRSRVISDNYIFENDTVKMRTIKLELSDMLGQGPYWGNEYEFYFGTYSEKKMRMMNEITGMPLDFWSIIPLSAEHKANRLLYGGMMARYLTDERFAGRTIFEDDGLTPMEMGYIFQ